MMTVDPLPRGEFDGYTRRHEADETAHSRMRHELRNELTRPLADLTREVSVLRDWQQRMIGGMMFASVMIGGGAIAGVIELTRHG